MRFQFLPDAVRDNLVPVNLGTGHWQLSPQGLERGIGHRLVVLRNGRLVVVFGLLHQLDQLLGGLQLRAHGQRLLDLLRADQLHVAVLVVVHLHLEDALHLGGGAAPHGHRPLRAPAAVPVVLRLELVVLDARRQGDGSPRGLAVPADHAAHPMLVVALRVLQELGVEGGPPRLCVLVRFVRLVVGRLFAQVVVLKGLLAARVEKTVRPQVVVLCDEDLAFAALDFHGSELVLVVLGEGATRLLLQQRVVVQQHSHIVEHLVKLTRGRMKDEIGHNSHFFLISYQFFSVRRHL